MKRNPTVARMPEAAAGLERITHLQEQLAATPVNSPQHRTWRAAMRIEVDAYRKSLDTEQATATHDAKPQPTPILVPRRRIHSHSRSAPRR